MRHSLIGCQKANCFESRCFSWVWWSDCFIFCHEACFFADQCDSEFQTFGIHIGRGGENSFILVTNMTNMSICGFGLCVCVCLILYPYAVDKPLDPSHRESG